MVLSKKEKALMDAVYELLKDEKNGVLTPADLLTKIPLLLEFNEDDLDPTMEGLQAEGYFTYEVATKKGDRVYCIALAEQGVGYARSKKKLVAKVWIKIGIVAATALLGVILKQIITAIIN